MSKVCFTCNNDKNILKNKIRCGCVDICIRCILKNNICPKCNKE